MKDNEQHVPSEEDVRVAYMDRQDFVAQIHEHDRKSDHTLSVEFGRFMATVRANALRKAARKLFADETAESGTTKARNNAIYGLWLLDEADRIARDAQ